MSDNGLWYVVGGAERRRGLPARGTTSDEGYLPDWGYPVWRDEFDSDLSKWNVRNNFTTFDTAIARSSNVSIENETLHIRGTWMETPQPGSQQGDYTHYTGYIDHRSTTSGLPNGATPYTFSQEYGRWEIRCQTPTGPNTRGALAAFWLRCNNTPGEIDIMEAWGGGGTMSSDWTTYVKDTSHTTIHSNTNKNPTNGKPYIKTYWRAYQHITPKNTVKQAPYGMHTYALERTPDYMALFYDDQEIVRVTPQSIDPNPENNNGTLAWLWDPDFFGGPMHVRLNLHVGPHPTYWGLPDPDNRQWTNDPLDFAVEHVRIWSYNP